MKRWHILGLITLVLAGWIVIFNLVKKDPSGKNPFQKIQDTVKKVEKSAPFHKKYKSSDTVTGSVFVPYWKVDDLNLPTDINLPENIHHDDADYIVYFGITANSEELNRVDPGYSNLEEFAGIMKKGDDKTLLTLRMLDEDVNTAVLDDSLAQSKIITQTIETAQTYGFDGVVLDFEHSVLPTQKTTDSITSFVSRMSEAVHAEDMVFALTIYGDTFYRARPYDITQIEPLVDGFYIMTYDFHKSYGTPGPNFPLSDGSLASDGSKQYGYSLEHLIDDMYSSGVAPDKMTFVFGMYGYDWMVDDQNRPLKPAQAVTLNQARSRYKPSDVTADSISSENTTSFTDESGQKHVVWFEDERSAQAKVQFIMTEGISKVGYWAWGYY
jgi:spore germination protein YaaH